MRLALVALISMVLSAAVFGWLFLEVARQAVAKVRRQEADRHQDLLKKTDEITARWMDVVNDLHDAILRGQFANKSVRYQLDLWNRIVDAADMPVEKPEMVDLTKEQGPAESDE